MNEIIFDDHKWSSFLPMTYTRSIGDLRAGIVKLKQRIAYSFEFEPVNFIVPEHLVSLCSERHPQKNYNHHFKGELLCINSRLRLNEETILLIQNLPDESAIWNENDIVCLKTSALTVSSFDDIIKHAGQLNRIEYPQIKLWNYLWELMEENGELIRYDYQNLFYEADNYMEAEPGVTMLNPYDVWIGEDTVIKPGVIIDASEGPVVIDENVTIMHNSIILGPAYIGKNSVIKVGAKIYPNTSIGPVCKIGGEVEDTIIQGYSNKQHDGFLGHAFLGEWVNLGADTNNSDLKNNYKIVKVYHYPSQSKQVSGSRFVGCFIGDHTKIGINSSINTGTVIGYAANVYGRDLITDFIPDFSWGEAGRLSTYRLEELLDTIRTVKERRKLTLSENEIKLISKIYNNEIRG